MKPKKRQRWIGGGTLALAIGLSTISQGAGLLIADGGFGGQLEIREHRVKVTINNGIAVTHVDQVFLNKENRQVEALYTFPVPRGASVANFSMWINGKEMVGEVLEKDRAREIYNSYKRVKRDPGLLEQADFRTFEMRIFPIAPLAEQRVQVTYYQELDVDDDAATYVYPLSTSTRSDIDTRVHGTFAIDLEILSTTPIAVLESPSHADQFVIAKHADTAAQASLELNDGTLARDIVLRCAFSRAQTGIDVLTSKAPNQDGYIYATVTAGEDLKSLDESMDYVFVIDISGSMGDDRKLSLSRDAVAAFVDALGEGDRYELIAFNVKPKPIFGELRTVSADARVDADTFLSGLSAKGGTALQPAIQTAYRYSDPDRVLNVLVLSDGLTEQRERAALLRLIGERPRNTKVFCIGVGNDVNRPLLEQIANDAGGLASFVSRGDNFDRQAAAFRRKLMHPVATDLQLAFNGVEVYDITPAKLPNLYHGKPVRVYGRYRGSGPVNISVNADIRGRTFSDSTEITLPKSDDTNPEIERMWAWHRIDELLKKADRTGNRNAVREDVVALGESHSIVTEFTSFLVLENDREYKRWKIDRRNRDRISRDRLAQARTRKQLDAIRSKAMTAIGPEAAKPNPPAKTPLRVAQRQARTPGSLPQRKSNAQSWDFGSGPVGPLFLLVAAWMRRRSDA
ncbi:MAG: VIT and VWA domain-containing protein [Kiritimatiellae bacterium]|nr:VIT and VWA domain-containing protein [Kiritimatiellia bacterium]